MTQALSLRLKPICIEFYQQTDCEIDSQFLAQIEHRGTVYKSGILKSSKSQFLSLSNIMWTEFLINQSDFNSNVLWLWFRSISAWAHSVTVQLDCGTISENKNMGGILAGKNLRRFCPLTSFCVFRSIRKRSFAFPFWEKVKFKGKLSLKW